MIIKTIQKYLPKLNLYSKKINIKELPLFLNSFYSFHQLMINNKPFLVISVKDKTLGPRQFKKHKVLLSKKTDLPLIWYMEDLHYHKMQRLIDNNFNFVIEDKQVYLPILNVAIKPLITPIRFHETRLNSLAINILERQILRGDLSGKNKLEIAEVFNVTQMTAIRAIDPLIAHELCNKKKVGVSKIITFISRNELWEYFKNSIDTPVKKICYTDKTLKHLPFSGISALSQKTMLADDEIATYAISKKAFKNRFSQQNFVEEDMAKSKLEVWDREPILIENNTINPLDIYTILKLDPDERVQLELKKLLQKINLETG